MKKVISLALLLIFSSFSRAQKFDTPFENSGGKQTTTYFSCIDYYKRLASAYPSIRMFSFDTTDQGYVLNLIVVSSAEQFKPIEWHKQNKVTILINNGIHPGEPDGIDASMMLVRDIATGKIKLPKNVVLAIIPVYNIGGSLNRNGFSRVNQNGPERYGFRGNAQNLDLNRDFIKSDSKNAKAFAKIFHSVKPDIFMDNHVSDGADYQYTMTLLTTQHDKLGGAVGNFLHDVFEPSLYKGMNEKNWAMTPYVNFEEGNADKGWDGFYDAPRYSTGYAALFETIAFMPETHMLKPFPDRVKSTYALMQTMIEQASKYAKEIIAARKSSLDSVKHQQQFALGWKVDSSQYEMINFKGYEADTKTSEVTGLPRLFYDHSKPFEKQVKFYSAFVPTVSVTKPEAYIIPQGRHEVIDLLRLNDVSMQRLSKDTSIEVEVYHIDDYKSYPRAYEKHHFNYDIKLSSYLSPINFLKGDYIIYTGQPSDRYIVETLEPLGDDSFFKWNFFDAVLQQKEGYSDYRWEDVAAEFLQQHPEVKQQLEEKKKTDSTFAASAHAQLDFIYKHSPYYEPAHLRYPVYRVNE
ncbi:MAG: M14 family metallopeptidase [Ilyomonas sp.]